MSTPVVSGKRLAHVVVMINWFFLAGMTLTAVWNIGYKAGDLQAMNSFFVSFTDYVHTINTTETKNEMQEEVNSETEHLRTETRHLFLQGVITAAGIWLETLYNVLLHVAVDRSDYPKLNIWVILNMLNVFIHLWFYFHMPINGVLWYHAGRIVWLLASVLMINYFRVNLYVSASNNAVTKKTPTEKSEYLVKV